MVGRCSPGLVLLSQLLSNFYLVCVTNVGRVSLNGMLLLMLLLGVRFRG